MKAYWEGLKTTFIGHLICAMVHGAYRVREWILINLNPKPVLMWSAEKLQEWKKARYLNPIIKSERVLLHKAREKYELQYTFPEENPLVSVMIPTWNRCEILIERTLPSIFNQTYKNYEVVVVGDCCTDNTEKLITSIHDPRVRFLNLSKRGNYPKGKEAFWQVAGGVPVNKALELCRGKWIAPLDDDDVFVPDHIEILLHHAHKHNLEFVYGKLKVETEPGIWKEKGFANKHMSMQNSTTMFRSYIKLFRADINSWRIGMTGDYQRTVRCREAGVRIGYLNKVVSIMPLRPGQTRMGLIAEDRSYNKITG